MKDWITDWDYDLNRRIRYIDVSNEDDNFRVDEWRYREGWAPHESGRLFSSFEDAMNYARKKARKGEQVRVVDLRLEEDWA